MIMTDGDAVVVKVHMVVEQQAQHGESALLF